MLQTGYTNHADTRPNVHVANLHNNMYSMDASIESAGLHGITNSAEAPIKAVEEYTDRPANRVVGVKK